MISQVRGRGASSLSLFCFFFSLPTLHSLSLSLLPYPLFPSLVFSFSIVPHTLAICLIRLPSLFLHSSNWDLLLSIQLYPLHSLSRRSHQSRTCCCSTTHECPTRSWKMWTFVSVDKRLKVSGGASIDTTGSFLGSPCPAFPSVLPGSLANLFQPCPFRLVFAIPATLP